MARAHTCFLQAQNLPWTASSIEGRADVVQKCLSRDLESGACTVLLRYPPGWCTSDAHCLSCDEELLLLEGDLTVDGQMLKHHSYAFFPSGMPRLESSSAKGAVVLSMFSASPSALASDTQRYDPAGLIRPIDVYQMPWLSGAEGSVTGKPLGNGLATKLLRRDATTGEQSFLYSSYAHHPPPSIMVGKFGHPMVEEIFMLAGEYAFGDLGLMRAGGYCWWREEVYHGPVGSRLGYLMFIRNLGGPLRNQFLSQPESFEYQPEYKPDLPAALADQATPVPDMDRW